MHYRQYYIAELFTSGIRVPQRGGDLIIVKQDTASSEKSTQDWELVYSSSEEWSLNEELYDLIMQGPEVAFSGPAILVRSDGFSHVFRGAGSLKEISSTIG